MGAAASAVDLALIALAILASATIALHGPSHIHRFAQAWQVGAAIDVLEGGNWLVPEYQSGLFRKPPLYTWALAPTLAATGTFDDWAFCLPNLVFSVVTGWLIYALGRRWFTRRVGVIAGLLWATTVPMSKLFTLALTDMMFTMWITLAILCVDRLIFHPARRGRRGRWLAGLWGALILGALTKGWGFANLPLVIAPVGLAVMLGYPWRVARIGRRLDAMAGLGVWMGVRRLCATAWAVRLHWGAAAMMAVMVPYFAAGFHWGGEAFADNFHFEIVQRITGSGEKPPKASAVPPWVYLIYFQLPVSLVALGALAIAPVTREPWRAARVRVCCLGFFRAIVGRLDAWFSHRSAVSLPLYWVLGVVIPFSLSHGFRADYLLPCYGAVAILGAWGIDRMIRVGRPARHGVYRAAWEVFRAIPTVLGVALAIVPAVYLLPEAMPEAIAKNLQPPRVVAGETWRVLYGMIPAGAALACVGVWASLTWRPRLLTGLIVTGMLGVHFMDTHFIAPQARSGDGAIMRRFSIEARPIVGKGDYHLFQADKTCFQVYQGRFGQRFEDAWDPPGGAERKAALRDWLGERTGELLVTTDRGLAWVGAYRRDANSSYVLPDAGKAVALEPTPEALGEVLSSSEPIESYKWGRIHLIRIAPDVRLPGKPLAIGFIRGRDEDEW